MKIIITGASQGIGKFLYQEFQKNNEMSVVGTYNSTSSNTNLFKLDISNYDQVKSFVHKYLEEKDEKVVLVNCAAINYNSFAHKSDIVKWENVIRVNLVGTFNMIQSLLPHMRQKCFGRIINFSSVTSLKPTPGISSYAASKAGLSGLIKSVACENASKNITINNINLGYSELGMIKEVPEEYLAQIVDTIPSKSLCKSEDIWLSVRYLMDCSYITGSSIDLNGGII